VHVDGVLVLVPQRQRAEPRDHLAGEEAPGEEGVEVLLRERRVAAAAPVRAERGVAAVAGREHEAGPAAVHHPEPRVLVVAAEAHHLAAGVAVEAPDGVDHLARARAAVDVVAEEHHRVPRPHVGHPRDERRRWSISP
jgi:hypothetical protein